MCFDELSCAVVRPTKRKFNCGLLIQLIKVVLGGQIVAEENNCIDLEFSKLITICKTCKMTISNSLMIHKIKTKEINTETEFGYVMKHLHKIKSTFISIFPLNTNLFEMLYQTLFLVFDILHAAL